MVLLAQWASPILREGSKPTSSHIPTHTLVQEEGANRSTTPRQAFFLINENRYTRGM